MCLNQVGFYFSFSDLFFLLLSVRVHETQISQLDFASERTKTWVSRSNMITNETETTSPQFPSPKSESVHGKDNNMPQISSLYPNSLFQPPRIFLVGRWQFCSCSSKKEGEENGNHQIRHERQTSNMSVRDILILLDSWSAYAFIEALRKKIGSNLLKLVTVPPI